MDGTLTVLLLLALMQIKHLFADFFMQTPWMLTDRERYIHMGRAVHAGIHCVFSILIFWAFGTSAVWIAILVLFEWVTHFHIDFWKASTGVKKGHTPADAAFWRAMGTDQALHHLTNIGMALVWYLYAS